MVDALALFKRESHNAFPALYDYRIAQRRPHGATSYLPHTIDGATPPHFLPPLACGAKPGVEHALHRHADALLAYPPEQGTLGHGTSPPAEMALANAPAAKQRTCSVLLAGQRKTYVKSGCSSPKAFILKIGCGAILLKLAVLNLWGMEGEGLRGGVRWWDG